MRILFGLTYYHPHVSGLTIYVKRLAEALAERGHVVTVLASQHDRSMARKETLNGVQIIRAPVAARISKGVVMPTYPILAARLARQHDVVSLHLPQLEAGLVAVLVKSVARRPVVLTYHCDLQLPSGPLSRLIDESVFLSNYIAATVADAIVAYTWDYAENSRLLSKFKRKMRQILPPVIMPLPDRSTRDAMRERLGLDGRRTIGLCTRVAADKGVEYLLQALPELQQRIPNIKLLHAGESREVLGEDAYIKSLQPLIERNRDRIAFLGVLNPEQLAAFYANLDVLTVSSVNGTESFGLVQVESMLSGTPVVATNLPGVREPVKITGMGEIVPIRDPHAIAEAIVKVIDNRPKYVRPREDIAETFDLERTLDEYEQLFGACAAQ